MSFTLPQLRHFVAAAETGRISRAAEHCNIAQPSLSTSLRNLEDGLGVALFRREASGLYLTAEGERLLRHAKHILSAVTEATEDTRAARDLAAGEIRIAVTETVSGFLVPALLRQIAQALPSVTVQIVEFERREAEDRLLAGEFDLSIAILMPQSERRRLVHDVLIRSRRQLWTCLDHPLLEKEAVSLADVAACDFALLDMDEHVSIAQGYWAEHGLAPRIMFRSKSLECIRSLVGQGSGVTILSDFVYRAWSHDGGRIRRRPLRDAVPTMDIGIAYKADRPLTPSARSVVELARRLSMTSAGRPAAGALPPG
ncbi:LysR substrate-binding domain-containing protein [Labrys monachus]|uniref:DNA-binding transcriptional LysR family regulator n=1 Tax=Labrys monachus TaxID=217067 RepID=A0ABU0FA95_9HYPH|nr:LysR substrate-binding domain-containing protein [Labrys monachus]MDQ0391520.1 DNA-binding transcriptional LysR family regulator [Labrys monachus]